MYIDEYIYVISKRVHVLRSNVKLRFFVPTRPRVVHRIRRGRVTSMQSVSHIVQLERFWVFPIHNDRDTLPLPYQLYDLSIIGCDVSGYTVRNDVRRRNPKLFTKST